MDLLYSTPIPLGRLVRAISDADAGGDMSYQVTVTDVAARPTAVVSATTTWQEFPTLWRGLNEVGGAGPHPGGVFTGCRVFIVYCGGVPHGGGWGAVFVPCPLT